MLTPARVGEALVARDEPLLSPSRIPAEVMLLAGLTLLGAVLRFATVSHQSFWLDEALAARELHLSFGSMLSAIGRGEPNPPLFFLIAWPWAKLFGTSEAGIRSLLVVAGTALIPIAYLCGRELVSRRAGMLAAAFTALSPFMIWYSQEAREYMLLAAFCGASFLFFARVWHQRSGHSLVWWSVFSALAVLTHYFAAFLVAPEALVLLYRERSRASVVAVTGVAVVQGAMLPHFISHASHPLGWIGAFPLSVRIKQVPVAFALGSLYQSSAVRYGLIGAAILAAVVIVLLVIGARSDELRGAGLAAAIAGAVLLVPLVLAAFGHDYYVPRALIAAWVPLALVIAAACTSVRTWPAGAALALVMLAAFVYAGIRIAGNATYQRPNWRGVAAALGPASGTRAVVANDGGFGAVPLALYLHGEELGSTSTASVTVGEIDVVGNVFDRRATNLPAGVSALGQKSVGSYLVQRFRLSAPLRLTSTQIDARAQALLEIPSPGAAVLIQRSSA
jgi:4-amino-4-deoxy-L-arabinose transferase-like glycosyltransferase